MHITKQSAYNIKNHIMNDKKFTQAEDMMAKYADMSGVFEDGDQAVDQPKQLSSLANAVDFNKDNWLAWDGKIIAKFENDPFADYGLLFTENRKETDMPTRFLKVDHSHFYTFSLSMKEMLSRSKLFDQGASKNWDSDKFEKEMLRDLSFKPHLVTNTELKSLKPSEMPIAMNDVYVVPMVHQLQVPKCDQIKDVKAVFQMRQIFYPNRRNAWVIGQDKNSEKYPFQNTDEPNRLDKWCYTKKTVNLAIDITKTKRFINFVQRVVFEHIINLATREHAPDTVKLSNMLYGMMERVRMWVEKGRGNEEFAEMITENFAKLHNDKVEIKLCICIIRNRSKTNYYGTWSLHSLPTTFFRCRTRNCPK